jgi:hypothetical protein
MSLVWTSKNSDLAAMRMLIQKHLNDARIPNYVTLNWADDELCILISHGGKSEFRLTLSGDKNGMRICETKRDISFLHRPFVSMVEKLVDKVLAEAGFVRK